jgi:hypothetical protein
MASRSLDTDILQVRTLYARTPQNGFIPSSHILIANGNGGTRWNSVSSIFPVSSFGVVYGNVSTSGILYGDLSFNTLQISTTGVGSLFQSYVDPVAKVLMLSNAIPPIAVFPESVPTVSLAAAQQPLATSNLLTQVTGLSSIRFIGVNDIRLSTITAQNTIFITISSFTSAGYQAISGETFQWRPTLYSTLSTTAGFASFVSSVAVIPPITNVGIPLSTTVDDLYFSSMTFSANHLIRYLDTRATSSSRMLVEVQPSFFFPPLYQAAGGDSNVVKEISTFIQLETVASGKVLFQESVNTRYLTSQVINTTMSNYFDTPIKMEINPYAIASNVALNLPLSTNLTIYHRIVNGLSTAVSSGFVGPVTCDNRTSRGLYIQLMNNTQF